MTAERVLGAVHAATSEDHAAPLHPIDLHAAERAAADLLRALGQPLDSPGMAGTPRRMAEAYTELLNAGPVGMTTFDSDGYDGLVLVADLPVRSLCEHHMLPFTGVAHVGYLPTDRVLGLSKAARVVDFFGRRAQTQERLTVQVARHLDEVLAPQGVGVVIKAEHSCMTLRGARATGSRTVTSTLLGRLRDDRDLRSEFLEATGRGGHRR